MSRNYDIMRAVLEGETMVSVAKRYGLSAPRVRDIVFAECKRQNEEAYWDACRATYDDLMRGHEPEYSRRLRWSTKPPLEHLRKLKDEFIT